MSEAEVLEIANLHAQNAISCFAIYVSFTFAFLSAAYLAGAKLSSSQVVIAIGMYLVSVTAPGVSLIVHTESLQRLVVQSELLDSIRLWNIPWSSYLAVVMSLGVIASLYFIWDVRRTKEN